MSRFIRFHAVGGLLLLTAALAAPSRAAEPPAPADPDSMLYRTVRIQVERSDPSENKEEENGSGIFLCHVDNQAYVLTANHVIFGKSRGATLNNLKNVRMIRLSFYKGAADAVQEGGEKGQASVFTISLVPGKDLLLLSFEVDDKAKLATLRPIAIPQAGEIPDGLGHRARAHAIGYREATSESWAESQGDIRRREPGTLHHSAAIEEGFSGGPLFDEFGTLIGLNIQQPEDKGTPGSLPGGRALPIDEVLLDIHRWVPVNCLPNNDEDKTKRAHNHYREAMRQVSLRNWKEAEKELENAIKENSLEGGSVHLQGMRYTEYLPHYHLGLTSYHRNHCGEALRQFQISEVHGVIRYNKRFKDLERIRDKCLDK